MLYEPFLSSCQQSASSSCTAQRKAHAHRYIVGRTAHAKSAPHLQQPAPWRQISDKGLPHRAPYPLIHYVHALWELGAKHRPQILRGVWRRGEGAPWPGDQRATCRGHFPALKNKWLGTHKPTMQVTQHTAMLKHACPRCLSHPQLHIDWRALVGPTSLCRSTTRSCPGSCLSRCSASTLALPPHTATTRAPAASAIWKLGWARPSRMQALGCKLHCREADAVVIGLFHATKGTRRA